MIKNTYAYQECLEDPTGTKFFFGRGGYIDVIDNVIVAHITVKRFKLATSNFSDYSPYAQELPVSLFGLHGMLEHLMVPETASAQKRLKSYEIAQKNKGAVA